MIDLSTLLRHSTSGGLAGFVEIRIPCPFCGAVTPIRVKGVDLDRYASGEVLVQNCFPYLSADDREILVSGICSRCYPVDPDSEID